MKSLINITLMKEQLKRFWAIGVLSMMAYLLFVILPMYSQATSIHNPEGMVWFMVSLLSMQNPTVLIIVMAGAFCTVMALYPYSFSHSAATAFHSFPISKKQLYWTNIAAASILVLLPLLFFSLISLIPVYYPIPTRELVDAAGIVTFHSGIHLPPALFPRELVQGDVVNTFPVVIGFFGRAVLTFVFYFSVFLLAVSVSGNRVIAILLCGAIPFIPVGVHALIELAVNTYVFGYEDMHSGFRLLFTMSLSNAAAWYAAVNDNAVMLYTTVYAVTAAVLFIIAYYCGHRRKQERTGDSVVFAALNNVLVFLVSMFGMISMGGFMAGMTQSRAGMYIGLVIGFTIAYFIAQMIAEKAFNISHKIKVLIPFGGIMAALYVLMLLVTHFGMASFVNHVPQASDLAGVSLSHQWRWTPAHERPNIYFNDPEALALALEAHQNIVDNQRYLRNVHRAAWHEQVPFTYLFHDGTTMYRTYILPRDFMESSGIDYLMRHPAVVLSAFPALDRPGVIEVIRLNFSTDGLDGPAWNNITVDSHHEILSLAEAIRQDVIDGAGQIWTDEGRNLDLSANVQVYREHHTRYRTGHINLGNIYIENTLAWMIERGYLD